MDLAVGIYLGVLSYEDVRKKSVRLSLLIAGMFLFVACIFWGSRVDLTQRALGGLTGAGMLVVSKVTREAIGWADSSLLFCLGIVVGFGQWIEMVCFSLFLCCIFCIVGLSFKRLTKKQRIPFIPFLLVGFLCSCLV